MSAIYDATAIGGRVSLRRIRLDPAEGRDVEPIATLDLKAALALRDDLDDAIAIAGRQCLDADRTRIRNAAGEGRAADV